MSEIHNDIEGFRDEIERWQKTVHIWKQKAESALATIKAKDEAMAIIRDKCEQYWNAHNIGDMEIHAVLEFIHIQTGG